VIGHDRRVTRLWIIGFSIFCGSVSLIYPFGRDQGSYAYAGWVLLDGGMPYLDVYAYKPPMNVLLHAPAIGVLGATVWPAGFGKDGIGFGKGAL